MRFQFVTVFACAVLFMASCFDRRPAGMPRVFPCDITVSDNGKAVEKASVFLYLDSGNGTLRISGVTGYDGKATIMTQLLDYSTRGAPAGSYKVVLHKMPLSQGDEMKKGSDSLFLSDKEVAERKRKEEDESESLIPAPLVDVERTPLRLVVKEKDGGSLVVDIAGYKK